MDVYARRNHSLHIEDDADSRVFCLYEDNVPNLGALGYFSISLKDLCRREIDALRKININCSNHVLYLDYVAVDAKHQNNGFANWLMASAFEKALTVMQTVGGLNLLALNAADRKAADYFRSDWCFEEVLQVNHPFMICRSSQMQSKLARIKILNTH